MYEVEVKARLRNKDEIIKKLVDLGCIFGEELHQVDHIFIPYHISFPPPLSVPVLRVRKQNNKYLFTMKISQSNRQDCVEHELEISDGDKMIEIMHQINYKKVPIVNKKRIKTKLDGMEIVIDVVENLGEFIEVERIVSEENRELRQKIQEELLTFLSNLGISRDDHLVGSKYDIMLYEKFGMNNFS